MSTAVEFESSISDELNVEITDLEELLNLARRPQLPGIGNDVAEVLDRRIGKASLAITPVAEELQISKRTLQRHLKKLKTEEHEEGTDFSSIRDTVRYYHAIQCLMVKRMSVEETSKYLDFSDRTSFTNAFKRWAEMPPTSFRKLHKKVCKH